MKVQTSLDYRIADGQSDFEAIHRLNYKTFVEEIPQHVWNAEGRLVDRFHGENTYAVCTKYETGSLIGMVAGRANRPFSLDGKLPDLDAYLPANRNVFEVRLLAVEKEHRNSVVFTRLVALLAAHYIQQGFDLAICSGAISRIGLYQHVGLVPFGPVVGAAEALFQPMYITLDSFRTGSAALLPPG